MRLKIIREFWIELTYDAEGLRIPRLVCRMFFYEGERMIAMIAMHCSCKQGKAFVE